MIKIKRLHYIFILIWIFKSCQKENNYENYFKTGVSNETNLTLDKIKFDTINLKSIESSYTGSIEYIKDSIVFIDSRFCWAFIFNLSGELVEKKLGQGRGPNELNTSFIDGYCFLENGKKIFIGSSNDIHIYDKNWNRIRQSNINWNGTTEYGTAHKNIKNPSPDEPSVYTLEYANLKLNSYDNSVFMPLYSEHPNFNGLIGYKYYKEGNILAELDLNDSKIKRLFGRRTPELLNYKYLMHHSMFRFDIDKNYNFYLSHEIDPLIYVYDKDYSIQYAFGCEGTEMDTSYTELEKFDRKKYPQLFFEDRPKKGYYTSIKIFEKQNLVFRSYTKGTNKNYDGLQIYRNRVLIADVEVPKGLEIKEFIYPYFYSNALIDEEKENIKILKFKI
jgi:hypothetical protein